MGWHVTPVTVTAVTCLLLRRETRMSMYVRQSTREYEHLWIEHHAHKWILVYWQITQRLSSGFSQDFDGDAARPQGTGSPCTLCMFGDDVHLIVAHGERQAEGAPK